MKLTLIHYRIQTNWDCLKVEAHETKKQALVRLMNLLANNKLGDIIFDGDRVSKEDVENLYHQTLQLEKEI